MTFSAKTVTLPSTLKTMSLHSRDFQPGAWMQATKLISQEFNYIFLNNYYSIKLWQNLERFSIATHCSTGRGGTEYILNNYSTININQPISVSNKRRYIILYTCLLLLYHYNMMARRPGWVNNNNYYYNNNDNNCISAKCGFAFNVQYNIHITCVVRRNRKVTRRPRMLMQDVGL